MLGFFNGTLRSPDLPLSTSVFYLSSLSNLISTFVVLLVCATVFPSPAHRRWLAATEQRLCRSMPECEPFFAHLRASELANVRSFRRGGRVGVAFHAVIVLLLGVMALGSVVQTLTQFVPHWVRSDRSRQWFTLDVVLCVVLLLGSWACLYASACLLHSTLNAVATAAMGTRECGRIWRRRVVSGQVRTLRAWWAFRRFVFERYNEVQYQVAAPAFGMLIASVVFLTGVIVYYIYRVQSVAAVLSLLWQLVAMDVAVLLFLARAMVTAVGIEQEQDRHADDVEQAAIERRFARIGSANGAGDAATRAEDDEWIEMAEHVAPLMREQKYHAHIWCLKLSWQVAAVLGTYIFVSWPGSLAPLPRIACSCAGTDNTGTNPCFSLSFSRFAARVLVCNCATYVCV